MAMPMFAVDSMFWEQLLWYIMIHWIENVSGATTKMWSTVDTEIFGMRLSPTVSVLPLLLAGALSYTYRMIWSLFPQYNDKFPLQSR